MYGVLYNHTTGDLQGIVEQCDKQKDGIEAFLLLSTHCDPMIYNRSNTLMGAIMEHGRNKVGTLDELLTTMREVRKRLGAYKDRMVNLPEARTIFIPSMMVTSFDGEVLHIVRMKHASGDFEKLSAAVEDFRVITKSSGGKVMRRWAWSRTQTSGPTSGQLMLQLR